MTKNVAMKTNQEAANTASSRLVQETPDVLPLHTNAAAFLFRGRRMVPPQNGQKAIPGIMGARRFFLLVGKMELGIKRNDPYADWHFHNVDRAIAKAHRRLDAYRSKLEEMTPSTRIEKGVTRPKKPHRVEYIRPSILGHQLMTLLEHVDDLLLDTILLGHRGVLTLEKKTELMKWLERTFRSALHSAQHYIYTGVTRDDFATRNVEAGYVGTKALELAINKMGECPEHYVKREAFSKYAPKFIPKLAAVDMPEVSQNDESQLLPSGDPNDDSDDGESPLTVTACPSDGDTGLANGDTGLANEDTGSDRCDSNSNKVASA